MGNRRYIDLDADADYESKLDDLVREIFGLLAATKPPIGPNPFSSTPTSTTSPRVLGPTGALASDDKFLKSAWFSREEETAASSAAKLGLSGFMELRFGVFHATSKSQIELLNAVRQSEIRTFGWPIGILAENREEFRPRPYGDGIRAEVSLAEDARTSFDYWALRSKGDFYLLQSLFEDQRRPGEIFFDTRIVRVTECLMFAERLYSKLGLPPETRVGVSISHKGLKGRPLTSASTNRLYFSRAAATDQRSTVEIVTVLGSMTQTRVDDVRKILEPLFMLFDFTEFQAPVYEEIVRNFENGIVR
jgi:hypothetical protein